MTEGVYTALVTPFTPGNEIDVESLEKLVEFQLASGVSGLVPVGTTGESPTLNEKETELVVGTVVDKVAGRVPVIAGAGANSTEKAIHQTKMVKRLGADASLQVVPYYNKPTQQGLFEHFTAVADAVDLPVMLYNVPGRTGTALANETILRLSSHPNITAVKYACGEMAQIMDLLHQIPDGVDVLAGDDNLTYPIISLGGKGVVSVASNLFPELMVEMVKAGLERRWEEAKELHYKLLPFFKALFIESNPIPIKAAMAIKGLISEYYRLPLCALSNQHRSELSNILQKYESKELLMS